MYSDKFSGNDFVEIQIIPEPKANMISKIKQNIISLITKFKNKRKLKSTNWGRSYGWFIEFEGEKIGELLGAEFEDMFWYKYKIISYNGFEKIVLDLKNWKECKFKFMNKHYNKYPENAFSSSNFIKKNNEYSILMRGLYLDSI